MDTCDNIFNTDRVGPSTRPIRQLPKAPSGRGSQNFRKERVVGAKKKKKKFQMSLKYPAHPFNQKIKILVDLVTPWF